MKRYLPIGFAALLVCVVVSQSAQACCKTPCIDIMPCPVSEPVQMPVCDPSIHVYELNGPLDYWTELMVPQAKPCEYRWDDFGFFWPSDDATGISQQQDPHSQQGQGGQGAQNGRHITLRPIRVDVIQTTKVIAHQRRPERRRAHVEGCFANPNLFIVEGIWFEK